MAFLLPPVQRSWPRHVAFVAVWNALHVAVFYAGLSFTNHWTWTHTFFICAVLGGYASVVATQDGGQPRVARLTPRIKRLTVATIDDQRGD
jgi:hypothetical protein